MQTLLFATIAVVGGFLVGRAMMSFVDFVMESIKKHNREDK